MFLASEPVISDQYIEHKGFKIFTGRNDIFKEYFAAGSVFEMQYAFRHSKDKKTSIQQAQEFIDSRLKETHYDNYKFQFEYDVAFRSHAVHVLKINENTNKRMFFETFSGFRNYQEAFLYACGFVDGIERIANQMEKRA